MLPLARLPSPSRNVWHLGPVPVRAYALCIVAGIVVALAVTVHRWRARGGEDEQVWDVAGWAIVFGIVGGRLYHVVTDYELYFTAGRHPLDAFKIWDGGLGIWGAIALGTVGAWIGCRRHGLRLSAFADAAAPGVAMAQALGRFGNWFNNELYGAPTTVAWRLQIHCMDLTAGHAVPCTPGGGTTLGYFQPTFLYEAVWDLTLALALIRLDRRLRLGRGTVFALYVAAYTAGRGGVEALRSDPAHRVFGLRLNDWTSIGVFLAATGWLLWRRRWRDSRETSVLRQPQQPPEDAASRQPAGGAPAAGAAPADQIPGRE